MNHCVRVLLLFLPSLITLGLLGVAFSTKWWIVPLQKNIPQENSLHLKADTRLYTMLIPITISQGLLSECIAYQNVKLLVPNSFDLRNDRLTMSYENCSATEFTCETSTVIARSSTRCIDQNKQCDRIIDCEDKSDEFSCESKYQISKCPDGYTECLDGKSCYRKDEQTCDGISNCMDNSDEMNCSEQLCHSHKHVYCSGSKKCARRENSYRCDGIIDCEDNSDEEDCQKCSDDMEAFLCDSKCFQSKYRCDNIVHCSDFRDELNCGNSSNTLIIQSNIYQNYRECQEKRLNPLNIRPPKIDSSLLQLYPNPKERSFYEDTIYYFQLIVFYSIFCGLTFTFMSVLSLLFSACCRNRYGYSAIYCHGFWMFFGCLFIIAGLTLFFFIWFLKKSILIDYERNLQFDIMIHLRNPSLQSLDFLGLSFWLACGAAFTSFISVLLSCCFCCTMGSPRSENKEYEIMQMHNY